MLQESKNYRFAQRFQFSPPIHKILLLSRTFLLFLLSTLRSLGRSFPLLTPAILLSWSFLILISLVFLGGSLFLLIALLLDSTLRSLGRNFPLLTSAILISLVFLGRSLFLLIALLLDSFRFSIFLISSCFILIF